MTKTLFSHLSNIFSKRQILILDTIHSIQHVSYVLFGLLSIGLILNNHSYLLIWVGGLFFSAFYYFYNIKNNNTVFDFNKLILTLFFWYMDLAVFFLTKISKHITLFTKEILINNKIHIVKVNLYLETRFFYKGLLHNEEYNLAFIEKPQNVGARTGYYYLFGERIIDTYEKDYLNLKDDLEYQFNLKHKLKNI